MDRNTKGARAKLGSFRVWTLQGGQQALGSHVGHQERSELADTVGGVANLARERGKTVVAACNAIGRALRGLHLATLFFVKSASCVVSRVEVGLVSHDRHLAIAHLRG